MTRVASTKAKSPNMWDEWKAEILSKMPHFKSLPFWTRLKIRMNQYPCTSIDTRETEMWKASQTYRTYFHDGKEYFYKWGSQ